MPMIQGRVSGASAPAGKPAVQQPPRQGPAQKPRSAAPAAPQPEARPAQSAAQGSKTLKSIFADHHDRLEKVIQAHGIDMEYFEGVALGALLLDPAIMQCHPGTVIQALIECAQDGIVPSRKKVFFASYWDKKLGVNKCQYQPYWDAVAASYIKAGVIEAAQVHPVYAGETFELDMVNGEVTHKVTAASMQDRGDQVGTYAIIRFPKQKGKPRRPPVVEYMTMADFDAVRSKSQSTAWTNYFSEMSKKTVARRAMKTVEIPPRFADLSRREDALYDFKRPEDRGPAELVESAPAGKALPPPSEQVTNEAPAEPEPESAAAVAVEATAPLPEPEAPPSEQEAEAEPKRRSGPQQQLDMFVAGRQS